MDERLLFVYGSLRKDQPLHYIIKNGFIEFRCDMKIHNYGLYTIPQIGYPFCKPHKGSFVHGEVYKVTDDILMLTDEIEITAGYQRRYYKNIVFYTYEGKPEGVDMIHIPEGDWVKYLGGQNEEKS